MSVMTAVYVPEGIAMAADSRITGTLTKQNDKDKVIDRFTLSDNGQKLFLLKNRFGVSYCGATELGGKTMADILSEFENREIAGSDNIDTIAQKLSKLLSEIDKKGMTRLFVCGYDQNQQKVYEVNFQQVNLWNISKRRYGAVWNGDIAHITNMINGSPKMEFDWNHMYLKDAIDFAEFIVDVACKAQRFAVGVATCGGPIDILLITKDGPRWIRHKILKP